MENLLIQFLGLAGVSAFIAALINAGKYLCIVADDGAGKISLILSLVGFVAMSVLKLFAPDVDIAALDVEAAKAAEVILYVLGLFTMLGLPAKLHGWYKGAGLPVIGYSHSKSVSG